MKLATRILGALVSALSTDRECDHSPEKLSYQRGGHVHCICGLSTKVKCAHTHVHYLLPRVAQCADCGETRGSGEK